MQAHDGLFKISETIHRSRMTQSARSTGLRQETENEIGLIDPTPFFFFRHANVRPGSVGGNKVFAYPRKTGASETQCRGIL